MLLRGDEGDRAARDERGSGEEHRARHRRDHVEGDRRRHADTDVPSSFFCSGVAVPPPAPPLVLRAGVAELGVGLRRCTLSFVALPPGPSPGAPLALASAVVVVFERPSAVSDTAPVAVTSRAMDASASWSTLASANEIVSASDEPVPAFVAPVADVVAFAVCDAVAGERGERENRSVRTPAKVRTLWMAMLATPVSDRARPAVRRRRSVSVVASSAPVAVSVRAPMPVGVAPAATAAMMSSRMRLSATDAPAPDRAAVVAAEFLLRRRLRGALVAAASGDRDGAVRRRIRRRRASPRCSASIFARANDPATAIDPPDVFLPETAVAVNEESPASGPSAAMVRPPAASIAPPCTKALVTRSDDEQRDADADAVAARPAGARGRAAVAA